MTFKEIPLSYDVLKDDRKGFGDCSWIIRKDDVSKDGTSYRSAALISHGFRQCLANVKAGFKFDKNDLETIDKNTKSLIMSGKCGTMKGGLRGMLLDNLGDSVNFIQGITQIQKEIFQNGPITTGMTLPKDFFTFKGNKPYKIGCNVSFFGRHPFVIYGWDFDENGMYWLCKNSWKHLQSFKIYTNQNIGIEQRGIVANPKPKENIPKLYKEERVKKYNEYKNNQLSMLEYDSDWGYNQNNYIKKYQNEVIKQVIENNQMNSYAFYNGDLGWNDEDIKD